MSSRSGTQAATELHYCQRQLQHCSELYDEWLHMYNEQTRQLSLEKERVKKLMQQSQQLQHLQSRLETAEEKNLLLIKRISVLENLVCDKSINEAQDLVNQSINFEKQLNLERDTENKLIKAAAENNYLRETIDQLKTEILKLQEAKQQTGESHESHMKVKCDDEKINKDKHVHFHIPQEDEVDSADIGMKRLATLDKTKESAFGEDAHLATSVIEETKRENFELRSRVSYLENELEGFVLQLEQLIEMLHRSGTELNWTRAVLYDLGKTRTKQIVSDDLKWHEDISRALDKSIANLRQERLILPSTESHTRIGGFVTNKVFENLTSSSGQTEKDFSIRKANQNNFDVTKEELKYENCKMVTAATDKECKSTESDTGDVGQ